MCKIKEIIRIVTPKTRNFNQAPITSPLVHQGQGSIDLRFCSTPAYQAPAYQAPVTQKFKAYQRKISLYVKEMFAVMRNMVNSRSNHANQLSNLTRQAFQVCRFQTPPTSGTLYSIHRLPIPKEDFKKASRPKQKKDSIPFPSRRNDERRRENAIDQFNALAILVQANNLMTIFRLELSLSELTPTCMTLELADRSISEPIGIAEDVYVTTSRALIDVYEGEITLRVGREAITFNLDQTSRYTADYNHMTANRIDVIDMACEEYSQEVLGFSDVISSGNPTPYYDPIVSTSSPTLTPFGDSDFLLFEEADSFLALEDDPTSPGR
ncbi:hypothetical protein Tco_1351585 [Tanacetum coccineum]